MRAILHSLHCIQFPLQALITTTNSMRMTSFIPIKLPFETMFDTMKASFSWWMAGRGARSKNSKENEQCNECFHKSISFRLLLDAADKRRFNQ